jgi:hypothetical protein
MLRRLAPLMIPLLIATRPPESLWIFVLICKVARMAPTFLKVVPCWGFVIQVLGS